MTVSSFGSEIPDWCGSITNRFSYKGFDFSFLFMLVSVKLF